MQQPGALSLRFLLWVTILNYCAQVPYYFDNYYIPYHVLPSLRGLVLLGLTLVWFSIGYVGVLKNHRYGYYVLLSFLIVEALFYIFSLISGTFLFQMQNHSLLIKIIFSIGYISGITSAYYAYSLIRYRY